MAATFFNQPWLARKYPPGTRLLLQGKLDYRIAGWAAEALYADLLAHRIEIAHRLARIVAGALEAAGELGGEHPVAALPHVRRRALRAR